MPKPDYYIVEHSPNLFAVMSEVTGGGMFGVGARKFKNFVAETKTRREAEAIIKRLENTKEE